MLRYVKVLPKETCLKISKLVYGEDCFDNDDDFLLQLPDSVFDSELKVSSITDEINAIDVDGATWIIPIFFIAKGSCIPFNN